MGELKFQDSILFGAPTKDENCFGNSLLGLGTIDSQETSDANPQAAERSLPYVSNSLLFQSSIPQEDPDTVSPSTSHKGNDPVTFSTVSNNGSTILLREKPVKKTTKHMEPSVQRDFHGVPIHDLLNEIKREKEINIKTGNRAPAAARVQQCDSEKLLTEKWRAKDYYHLTGPEKAHRRIMKWIKCWDEVVFNKGHSEGNDYVDSLGRPLKKILLIHGSPGIGKTTAAQVLARQAGYNIMEINASDERSGKVVSDRVRGVSDSHRVTSSGLLDKPVCIVADEVEGAAESGFIQVLLNLVKGDERAQIERTQRTHGSKKKRHLLLKRPIIAICNDVFAGCLRHLRPYCEMVTYTRSSPQTLTSALQRICKAEKIQLNENNLLSIVNSADGDLRQCLNMIQLSTDSILGQEIFEKDLNLNWSKLVNRVFRARDDSKAANSTLSRDILAADFDKVIPGAFHLYVDVPYADDMLYKPTVVGEWNDFYERINSGIYRQQFGQLGVYLPHIVLAYHELFKSLDVGNNDRKVATDFDFMESLRSNRQMSQDFWTHLSLPLKSMFPHGKVVTELMPYSLKIVSPTLGSGSNNRQTMMAQADKIRQTATKMTELSLRFVNEVLENNVLVYRIDPPLEQVAILDEADRQKCSVGIYSVRDKIKEAMKQQLTTSGKRARPEGDDEDSIQGGLTASTDEPSRVKRAKSVRRDFFGRVEEVVAVPCQTVSQTSRNATAKSERIWVKFIEGFSNAVKKDLTWRELWQN